MAVQIDCGIAHENEKPAIRALLEALSDDWALLSNLPQHVTGGETDTILLGPRGLFVVELKNHFGEISAPLTGPWKGIPEKEQRKGSPLEQATKAAQKIKDRLTAKDPELARTYVDALVLMTNPNCSFSRHEDLRDRVGLLSEASALVASRLSRFRARNYTSNLLVSAITILTGQETPPKLLARWRDQSAHADTYHGPARIKYDTPEENTSDVLDADSSPNTTENPPGWRFHDSEVAQIPTANSSPQPPASSSLRRKAVLDDSTTRKIAGVGLLAFIIAIGVAVGAIRQDGLPKSEASGNATALSPSDTAITKSISGDLSVTVSGWTSASAPPIAEGVYRGKTVFLFPLLGATSVSDVQIKTMRLGQIDYAPDVVISYYSGGAHCCTLTKIAIADARGEWHVIDAWTLDGELGFSFADLDGDGLNELISYDNSFLYAFGCYACSYAPTRIQKLVGLDLRDVTEDQKYKIFLRAQLSQMEQRGLANSALRTNGYLGGWVAAKAQIGELDDAWQTMLASYDRNSQWPMQECLTGAPLDTCPLNSKRDLDFPTALLKHLLKFRYITAEQATILAGLSSAALAATNER